MERNEMNEKDELFEELLGRLMLEEPRPTRAAFLRWSEGYPQYREALARFFVVWGEQERLPEEPMDPIEEELLVARTLSFALRMMRQQDQAAMNEVKSKSKGECTWQKSRQSSLCSVFNVCRMPSSSSN